MNSVLKYNHMTESTSVTGTYINKSWAIYKKDDIVFLQLNELKDFPAGAFSMSGVVPQGYRPRNTLNYSFVTRQASPKAIGMGIDANGTLSFYNYGPAVTGLMTVTTILTWSTL